MCCELASIVSVRVVDTDSRNRLVLHGQLYIADSNDEGNTLKPYSSEKKTVVVLETLVLEHACASNLVQPHIMKSYLPLMPHT